MRKRVLSLALALVLAVGLAVPSLAAGPTFTDVPESHWAYTDVESAAAEGLMKGTGGGLFSPDMKVSVAQFLTLVGRVVFPDVKAEGADWYGPYITAAQEGGLLAGTQVNVNAPEAEISRYDMAVILRGAAKKLGKTETLAQQSQVTDYGLIPNMYTEAVLAVYGMGLIQGDQNGNFNGANTMMRSEVATVVVRLYNLKTSGGGSSTGGGNGTAPGDVPDYTLKFTADVLYDGIMVVGERIPTACTPMSSAGEYIAAPYGEDRSGFVYSSSDPSVVQVELDGNGWYLTALSLGTSTITFSDPYGVSETFDISVVSAREGIGTETYTVRVDLSHDKHTIRGNAYTETTHLYDTPFKLYYTRDGGKTSQLVAEGKTPIDDGRFRTFYTILKVELPADALYSEDAGLYVSAEAELDGQRIVTSDLRTDGRAYVKAIAYNPGTDEFYIMSKLTPPEGEKSHFSFKGYVLNDQGDKLIRGATIQLYHKDGALVGETTSRTDGTFEMECEVDALDGGFDKRTDLYRVFAWGYIDEAYYCEDGIRPNGQQILESLVRLHIASTFDEPGDGNYRLTLYPSSSPVSPK